MMSLDAFSQQNHQNLARVWSMRVTNADQLTTEEQHLLKGMQAHRALYPMWDRLNYLNGVTPMMGEMNLIAHTIVHAALEAQIEDGNPPEVEEALHDLIIAGFSRNGALHVLGSMLVLELWGVARTSDSYNDARYRGRIGLIRQELQNPGTLEQRVRKTGRNDPCLCGSGKKFKKCCIDHLPIDLDPGRWAFILPDGLLYSTPESMAQGPEEEPFILLQNLSAVAQTLEKMGDLEGAWQTLLNMLEIGEPDPSALENVYEDMVVFGLNHHDFAALTLQVMDEIEPRLPQASGVVAMTFDLDRADLLARAGRVDESAAIYQQAIAQWQDADPELREMLMDRWDFWKSEWQPQ